MVKKEKKEKKEKTSKDLIGKFLPSTISYKEKKKDRITIKLK